MSEWTCWRCTRSGVPHSPGSALCNDCHARLRAEGKRWCSQCRQALPASAFAAAPRCFTCDPAYHRRWRETSPRWEVRLARRRERYATDPEYREMVKARVRAAQPARRVKEGRRTR